MTTPTIETLSAVVEGHSQQFVSLHKEVADVGQRVEALFNNLSNKLDAQRDTVNAEQRRITDQQIVALANSKPDIKGIATVIAAIVGILVSSGIALGSLSLNPIREKLNDAVSTITTNQALQQNRNLKLESETNTVNTILVETRIALSELKGQEEERHAQYLRDLDHTDALYQKEFDHLDSQITSLDSQLIKRPEINALLNAISDTVNRLSARFTDMQHEWGNDFNVGDALKSLESRLNALQLQTNASGATIAPPKPAE